MESKIAIETGPVVVVTGAGKGLGAAFARSWGARKGRVVVNNRSHPGVPSTAEAVAEEIRMRGGQAVAETSDVSDDGAAEAVVDTAIDSFGGLDALILNAGIAGEAARFVDSDPAAFHAVMAINFHANIALVKAALPRLLKSRAGRILFVSSTAGLYGVHGRAAYAASKGALNGFALSLADELRRDAIGVNILMPYAATNMTDGALTPDLERLMAPDKVAATACWLTSPDCTATGETWVSGAGFARQATVREAATLTAHPNGAERETVSQFSDGQAAFQDFLSAVTERMKPSEKAEAL
ncbi:SDR family NAD(P)-dependent oxidoreductase [Parasphingopyxis algicola]|uniref:SDR family NAD(P)-dependent oxidoreductase n=1 Tax=Parasphingopyxis algicola TaxID=2026624 RepID=UPI0015A07E22|nr:SDR family NAD(P)-dependent oxidoreductase [Parasphingopyxis algicola]QLC24002.1 SDR family NAD(P)-dependent oxidoreductase [Parasphingopyxis algicola]